MKINNIVGFFHFEKTIATDIMYDILCLAKEDDIFILKIKDDIKIKNYPIKYKKKLRDGKQQEISVKVSTKKAFNNCLQVNFIDNISLKFFKNGKVHASGFKKLIHAAERIKYIANLLELNTPKNPIKIEAEENEAGIVYYTNENGTTYILGQKSNQQGNIYQHKVRVYHAVQKYSTGRKKDKTIQLEICQRDDCVQVEYDETKNLFYSLSHLKKRFIYNNHLNFIGVSKLCFIVSDRNNLPAFYKYYISNDKLYYLNRDDPLPFGLLKERYFEEPYQPHTSDKYLEFPTFDFTKFKWEYSTINVKESIGDSIDPIPIDKTLFFNCFKEFCLKYYPDTIEVKYTPDTTSGVRFVYIPFDMRGSMYTNTHSANICCKKIPQAKIVANILKDFYKEYYPKFTEKAVNLDNLNIPNLDLFKVFEKMCGNTKLSEEFIRFQSTAF